MSGRRPDVDTGQCRPLASPAPSRPFSVSSSAQGRPVPWRLDKRTLARRGLVLGSGRKRWWGGRHEIDRSPRVGTVARVLALGALVLAAGACSDDDSSTTASPATATAVSAATTVTTARTTTPPATTAARTDPTAATTAASTSTIALPPTTTTPAAKHDFSGGVADRRAVHRRARTQRGRPDRRRSRRRDHRRGVLGRVRPGPCLARRLVEQDDHGRGPATAPGRRPPRHRCAGRRVADWGTGNPTITPAQLLSNSSGLVGLFPDPTYAPYLCQYLAAGTLQDCAASIFTTADDDADIVAPDTEFRYGGAQWQVAGAVAEVASGKPWAQLIDEIYVQPCGLTTLAYNNHFAQLARRRRVRVPDGVRRRPVHVAADHEPEHGGRRVRRTAGLRRAAVDAPARRPLRRHQVLSQAALDRMHADRIGPSTAPTPTLGRATAWAGGSTATRGRITDPGAYGSVPWLDLDGRLRRLPGDRSRLRPRVGSSPSSCSTSSTGPSWADWSTVGSAALGRIATGEAGDLGAGRDAELGEDVGHVVLGALGPMDSAAAICGLVCPAATSSSTSRSRPLSVGTGRARPPLTLLERVETRSPSRSWPRNDG